MEGGLTCRVLVVGDTGVGKTALITRFLGDQFLQVGDSHIAQYFRDVLIRQKFLYTKQYIGKKQALGDLDSTNNLVRAFESLFSLVPSLYRCILRLNQLIVGLQDTLSCTSKFKFLQVNILKM